MTPDELFGLHTKPELLRLFPHLPASARKAELLDALRARQPTRNPIGTGIRTPAKPSGA